MKEELNSKEDITTMLKCEVQEGWDRCQDAMKDAMAVFNRQRINVEELLGYNK